MADGNMVNALPKVSYPGNVPGLLYEPRAFWDIGVADDPNQPVGVPSRIIFNRENFTNGEKYPVTLTKLLIAPTGYIFREFENGPPIGVGTYHACGASAFTRSLIQINVPQRQHYSRRVLLNPSYTAVPSWEPQIRGSLGGAGGATDLIFASSLWNVCRWDFDHVMVIPRDGTMEIQLAAIDAPDFGGAVGALDRVDFTVGVYEGPPPDTEDPGRLLLPGNVRVHERSVLRYINASAEPGVVQDGLSDPNFGEGLYAAASPFLTTQWFPGDQQLSAREYDTQNATQAGSTPVTGFAVQIDQINYDEQIQTVPLVVADQPISPLALKTPVRARMHNGGTGNWWWRPWAPLALVCPTITPAQVYDLPEPITLRPGDDLEIELQTPAPITIGLANVRPQYTVGVSLCGYAAIEG